GEWGQGWEGVRPSVEGRGVQDGRWEVESVLERKIQGVDRLRRHPPFVAADGFTQLGELMMIFPFLRSPGVPERIITTNDEPAIIAPFLGITDSNTQSFELGFGLRFCRWRHPGQRVDSMVEPGTKFFNHHRRA